jgi:hypothetical protein
VLLDTILSSVDQLHDYAKGLGDLNVAPDTHFSGSNNSHMATLVAHHSRYVVLLKMKGKDIETVI